MGAKLPHPSSLLILNIDEALDSKELRLEIDRCYSYLGAPVVRTASRPEGMDAPYNVLRFNVKNVGPARYFTEPSEETDELWAMLASWLYNQLHMIDNQMKIFNRRQREEGNPEIVFDHVEIALENGSFVASLRTDSISGVDPAVVDQLRALREAISAGDVATGLCAVTMPSDAAFEAQREAGVGAKAECEAAARAAAEAELAVKEAVTAQAEDEAEALFIESPTLVAQAAEEALLEETASNPVVKARIAEDVAEAANDDSQKTAEEIVADRVAEEAHLHELMEEKYALPEADFVIDYSTWTLTFSDGSTLDFCATAA